MMTITVVFWYLKKKLLAIIKLNYFLFTCVSVNKIFSKSFDNLYVYKYAIINNECFQCSVK